MKRLHVHVQVDDLAQSIRFYSTLFAAEPSVVKEDYAKWMLDDPRVNFAIGKRCGNRAGVSHLGIQTENEQELADVSDRLARAERPIVEEKACHLLLCQIRQAMDRRSAGRALGGLLDLRRGRDLRRQLAEPAEDRNRLRPAAYPRQSRPKRAATGCCTG